MLELKFLLCAAALSAIISGTVLVWFFVEVVPYSRKEK